MSIKGGASGEGNTEKPWLINLITVLIVTVLAGLIVWGVTKPPLDRPQLSYSVKETGKFEEQDGGKYFFAVTLQNEGDDSATDVVLQLSASSGLMPVDFSVTRSPTIDDLIVNDQTTPIEFKMEKLRPGESVRASLGYQSSEQPILMVDAASDKGKISQISDDDEAINFKENPWILFGILVSFAAVTYFLIKFVRKKLTERIRKKFASSAYRFKRPNNAAFLLIHSGSHEEAKNILAHDFRTNGADPISLTNYAVCLALEGKAQQASGIVGAVKSWLDDEDQHDVDVVTFNENVVKFLNGDMSRPELNDQLTDIVAMNEEIGQYIERSSIL